MDIMELNSINSNSTQTKNETRPTRNLWSYSPQLWTLKKLEQNIIFYEFILYICGQVAI